MSLPNRCMFISHLSYSHGHYGYLVWVCKLVWAQGAASGLGARCVFQCITKDLPSSGSGWGYDEFMWVQCFEDELSAYLSTHSLVIKGVNIISHVSRSAIFLSLNWVVEERKPEPVIHHHFGRSGCIDSNTPPPLKWVLIPVEFGFKTYRVGS